VNIVNLELKYVKMIPRETVAAAIQAKGDKMASDNRARFAVDDAFSTAENLAAFGQVLEGIDAVLGAALKPHLAPLASGQSANTSAILDSLYSALAASDAQSDARDSTA
jgi:hypothetical protein